MINFRTKVADSVLDYIDYISKSDIPNNTLSAYRRDLSKFVDFAVSDGIDDITEVDPQFIASFKEHLSDSGLSVSSSSRTLSALRSFFAVLVENNVLDSNPAKAVHNDKSKSRETSILSQKEIDLLLNQPDKHEPKGVRDRAMLELLYATGIKVSELIDLDVDDVNFQISFINVGSAGKQRYIPLYKLALKSLQNYVNNERKMLVSSPVQKALFVNCNGERMTRQGVWKILKYYAAAAGIKSDITPHTIRHSFAAHLLQNGADIRDIQEILGHSDIASTQRYAQFLKEKVKESYIKFHPRA
ncbi:MAG: tyrosine recombinase [Clostridia bacterium]|nr:tyrosine recombinase [Clostridia bacterium]